MRYALLIYASEQDWASQSEEQAQAQFQVPLIFAGLVALAVEGIVMYWLMAILEARSTRWAQRSGFAQA